MSLNHLYWKLPEVNLASSKYSVTTVLSPNFRLFNAAAAV